MSQVMWGYVAMYLWAGLSVSCASTGVVILTERTVSKRALLAAVVFLVVWWVFPFALLHEIVEFFEEEDERERRVRSNASRLH